MAKLQSKIIPFYIHLKITTLSYLTDHKENYITDHDTSLPDSHNDDISINSIKHPNLNETGDSKQLPNHDGISPLT